MVKFCSECGTPRQGRFCGECGHDLGPEDHTQAMPASADVPPASHIRAGPATIAEGAAAEHHPMWEAANPAVIDNRYQPYQQTQTDQTAAGWSPAPTTPGTGWQPQPYPQATAYARRTETRGRQIVMLGLLLLAAGQFGMLLSIFYLGSPSMRPSDIAKHNWWEFTDGPGKVGIVLAFLVMVAAPISIAMPARAARVMSFVLSGLGLFAAALWGHFILSLLWGYFDDIQHRYTAAVFLGLGAAAVTAVVTIVLAAYAPRNRQPAA